MEPKLFYDNLQLEDLENEIWVDCIGFDGIYEVSNLGRVKSLQREVNTRWGTPRLVYERILKQCVVKKRGRIDSLLIRIADQSKNVGRLIFCSFYPNIDFGEKECVMHDNKNCLDNRLVNLKKVTRKKSKATDMIKSVPSIIATQKNLDKAQVAQKEFYDSRTHKECSVCGKIDFVENFPDKKSKCQSCLNNYVVSRRDKYEYKGILKKCNCCGEEKKDAEFPKLDNTCKLCRFKIHKKYADQQRKEIGDQYVRQYGKFNYGLREFTPEIIDKLRLEIIEKRKPKHTLDGRNFASTQEFARYILEKYKIPISTVEKRIADGKTEYECTLTRKEYVRHNIKKNGKSEQI